MRSTKDAVDVGIVSANADSVVRFYSEVLGLEYVEAFETRVGKIHRLRFGSSWIKVVEASGGSPPPPGSFADPGLRYITFETPDLDDVWQRAIERGIEIVAPLAEHEATGARAGSIRDPDGNIVELLHRR